MKTTIDLPDELLIAAKKRAAEQRQPLRALFEEALRALLRGDRAPRTKRPAVKWVTVRGAMPKDLDLSDRARMHDWLRRGA